MEEKIRHRRLYAFYESKVLNALLLVVMVSLFLLAYMQSLLLPVICGSIAMAFFIGYALWLWIKKPKQIVINKWLSNINTWYILYFLIVMTMQPSNVWWYLTPIILATILLCLGLVTDRDERFDI